MEEAKESLACKPFFFFFLKFWTIWKARNGVAFKDEVLSIQHLKTSFVNLLWSETKLSIVGGPLIIVGFIDWVGCK